ncbi:hypothetical protein E8D34_06695 [Nocardioides sp. GY 10113]|uniref:hypothetical protein n=1 Tax=Nocardioides sp. GY 10113 TaxID=2569761 RepID=UPI0010A82EC3|nr:hypothetical protein [Nocardioides sp. GY 10113]TIC87975.1 hypothetical protein E8D34_06695 [Nocardioides sp. GY 10113]
MLEWPTTAQEQARRNAMVAATACAERRADREEVERFLTARGEGPAAPTPPEVAERDDDASARHA